MNIEEYFDQMAKTFDNRGFVLKRNPTAECRMINRHIPLLKDTIVLDIGCGTGRLTNELTHFGYNIRGIDISRSMIDISKFKYPQIEKVFSCIDFFEIDEIVKFDYAISIMGGAFGVITNPEKNIEHIVAFVRKLYRVLKPGGIALIEYLNAATVLRQLTQADIVCGNCIVEKSLVKIEDDIYEAFFTQNEISMLFSLCGFKVNNVFEYNKDLDEDRRVTIDSNVGIIEVQKFGNLTSSST